MLVRQSAKSLGLQGDSGGCTQTAWPQKDGFPRVIKPGWTVHLSSDARLYYCNHLTRSSSWLPPADTHDSGASLPFGWEEAVDSSGSSYYINHVNQTTTKDPPPKDWAHEEPPPQPRHVTLVRDSKQGFGFVAGSEKPVIVRFVTEGGPSDGKLLPGDQILEINGEDVKHAPRDHAIQLVRSCPSQVSLTVCQPPLDNSARKSALLSVAKKARLRSHPSRVRFAEGVVVNGSPLFPPSVFSTGDRGVSSVPIMPNVLKVFLENGQTKSFKYDPCTTVQDVVESLLQKLCIVASEHFCLMLEHVLGRRNKLSLLQPTQLLAKIAARPGSHNLRCLFRVAFVPSDPYDLLQRDPVAFEYLYMQCCNDVVQERFAPELKYDIALRLASLHIQQHALSNNMTGKLAVKNVEREFGLERFVPVSLMESMKRKELRKLIGHFLKMQAAGPNQRPLSGLQAKLHYLHIIGELPSYGAKCFSTNLRDSNAETVILISPKFGISQIAGLRNSVPVSLAEIQHVSHVTVSRIDELSRELIIHLGGPEPQEICLTLEDRDAEEMVLVLRGYYQLMAGTELPVDCPPDNVNSIDDTALNFGVPPYLGFHHVRPEWWSYFSSDNKYKLVNLSISPPYLAVNDTESINCKAVDSNMNSMTSNANARPNGVLGNHIHDRETFENNDYPEGKNEEALRRMSEMQRLVMTSQQYLTEQSSEYEELKEHREKIGLQEQPQDESDSEGSSHMSSLLEAEDRLAGGGELRHSDSLLLLTQGHKLLADEMNDVVRNLDISGDTEPSESDTDSLSTPTSSPSHRPASRENSGCYRPASLLKPSDSSFGLHSPDNVLPVGCRPSDNELRELLLRLQQDSSLPYHFAEGTLYLDPDIIDLTMIPPPITPDHEGLHSLMNVPSSPPTPFADQAPLDQQLMELMNNSRNNSNEWDQQMLDQLLDSSNNLDLDAFLATVVVPAPCQRGVELTPEEVSAFIIPPPPPTSMPPTHNSFGRGNYYNSLDYGFSLRIRRDNNFLLKPTLPLYSNHNYSNYRQHQSGACRASLARAEEVVRGVSERLLSLAEQCRGCVERGGGARQDVAQCRTTQAHLCAEARSLVTSSKLLVQAATAEDRNSALESPLAACLTSLSNIAELAEDLSQNTDSPSHTMALILRSREVSECLGSTLQALDSSATSQSQSALQKCAEDLVTALSALLRGLKIFTS